MSYKGNSSYSFNNSLTSFDFCDMSSNLEILENNLEETKGILELCKGKSTKVKLEM